MFNTPRAELTSARLAPFIAENAELIPRQLHVVPQAWLATVTHARTARFSAPDTEPALAHAFALGTCDGCHGAEADNLAGFHIAPERSGRARISRFLYDPEAPERAELTRRADALRAMLSLRGR